MFQKMLSLVFDILYSAEVGDELLNIDGEDDNNDFYTITTTAVGELSLSYRVTSIANSSLSNVYVYEGLTVIGIETFFNDDQKTFLVVPLIHIGEFTIHINTFSDYVAYDFKLTFIEKSYSQDDAGTGSDSSSMYNAPILLLNTEYSGDIGFGSVTSDGGADFSDFYRVDISSSGYLNMVLNLTTDDSFPDISIQLLNADFEGLYSEPLYIGEDLLNLTSPIPKAGEYYFELYSNSWNATYTIELAFTEATLPIQNDANLGEDASEDYDHAPVIGVNTTIIGTVGEGLIEIADDARDDKDIYKFGSLNYGRLEINMTIIESEENIPLLFVNVYNQSDLVEDSLLKFRLFNTPQYASDNVILMPGDTYYLDIYTFDKNTTYEILIKYIDLPYTPLVSENTTTTSIPTVESSSNTDNSEISNYEETNAQGLLIRFTSFIMVIITLRRNSRKSAQ